jgi:hypothetical protein
MSSIVSLDSTPDHRVQDNITGHIHRAVMVQEEGLHWFQLGDRDKAYSFYEDYFRTELNSGNPPPERQWEYSRSKAILSDIPRLEEQGRLQEAGAMSEDALAISLVKFIGRDHPLSQRLIEDYGASVLGDYSAAVDCFIDVNELMDMRARARRVADALISDKTDDSELIRLIEDYEDGLAVSLLYLQESS